MTVLTPKALINQSKKTDKKAQRTYVLKGLIKLLGFNSLLFLFTLLYVAIVIVFLSMYVHTQGDMIVSPWFRLIALYPIILIFGYAVHVAVEVLNKLNSIKKP